MAGVWKARCNDCEYEWRGSQARDWNCPYCESGDTTVEAVQMWKEDDSSNRVEERLLRNMPCRPFDPLIYRDDWEAFRMLNARRFEVLYEEDFRRNFAKQDAFMILARAAAHVVGVHPYHEVI